MKEQELIQQIIEGDENAFRDLYKIYSDRVFNTAFSIIQHQEEAEEITQDVFIEIYKSIAQFRNESSLYTWIYKITVSKCSDRLKKQKAKKRFVFLTSLFADDQSIQHDKPHFNHPGIVLENKEHAKVLFYALSKIPEKQRMAFTLQKVEGLSNAEVAESMSLSVSAVESLLFRANENLRYLLSDYYKKNIKTGASSFLSLLLSL